MLRAFCLFLLCVIAGVGLAQNRPALKLKVGDRLGVAIVGVTGYDGEYVVLTDGSISGKGFGRLVVEGKTLDQATQLVSSRLRRVLKDPAVSLILMAEQPQFVYLAGAKLNGGNAVTWIGSLDVRQLLSGAEFSAPTEDLEATIFRDGKAVAVTNVGALLAGNEASVGLKPGDVVALNSVAVVRAWVTGLVVKPGEIRLKPGLTAQEAISLAGGLAIPAESAAEAVITLTRGGQSIGLSEPLVSGDTVRVALPEPVRVSVGGEAKLPGRFTLRQGATAFDAVASAGGVSDFGSKQSVLVVRKGEAIVVSLDPTKPFILEDGDQVNLTRNARRVVAMGEVANAGTVLLEEGRKYRLTDVIAGAGGLAPKGSFFRVYLGRPGQDGRLVTKMYHVDRFLKDGDLTQNPEIEAGDVVYVDQPKGINFVSVQQLLNSALIFFNIANR